MARTRRSARLNKASTSPPSSTPKIQPDTTQLESVVEKDDTPEVDASFVANVNVLATPSTTRNKVRQLQELSGLKTPQTAPQPGRGEMHPKTVHQTTSKAPDSGLKLGFADISKSRDIAKTPSKLVEIGSQSVSTQQSLALKVPPSFESTFPSETELSTEAKRLMDSVRADAAKIKAQMIAEQAKQVGAGGQADQGFRTPRKIASAKGKASRFSDVHMAQFKKMDSIENHPSAYRAQQGYVSPAVRSLKRSPSKAGLDDVELSAVTSNRAAKPASTTTDSNLSSRSPSKSNATIHRQHENQGSVKRARRTENPHIITDRASSIGKATASTLYSPTKSSLARTELNKSPSPLKSSSHRPGHSARTSRSFPTIRTVMEQSSTIAIPRSTATASYSALPQSRSFDFKPLPPTPSISYPDISRSKSVNNLKTTIKNSVASKLPSFAGLRSILRSGRKNLKDAASLEKAVKPVSAKKSLDRGKKVDFTPSVKSRYAVKLAADSPLPAKFRQDTPYKGAESSIVPTDSTDCESDEDFLDEQKDEVGDIVYPVLPQASYGLGPVNHTFSAKAKEHNRRESQEFKSIFTDLHPEQSEISSKLTMINTAVNKTNPIIHATNMAKSPKFQDVMSTPTTIRQVRASDVSSSVHPFEDRLPAVPHGLSGKKRRYESIIAGDKRENSEDAKENENSYLSPPMPGAWNMSKTKQAELYDTDDEGMRRGGKRIRGSSTMNTTVATSPGKKVSSAREAAVKNAKERKGKGILSLSRLNVLSRPKDRA